MISISVSLKPHQCGVLSRYGLWDKVPNVEEWIAGKLQAMGDIPLGPYILAMDYDSGEFHLIHSTLFRRQVAKGADMESFGVAFIAPNEQIAVFKAAQAADAEREAQRKLTKKVKKPKRIR